MSQLYLCFIGPLLIATLILLVVLIWEYRHERPFKIPGFVLAVLLVVLAGIVVFMPWNEEALYIHFFYFGSMVILVGFFFIFFLLFLVVLRKSKHGRVTTVLGIVQAVLLVVILTAAISFPKTIIITTTHFRVSIVVDNATDSQENAVLYVPIPKDYPEEYEPFISGNHSLISTEYGEMLSLSTNTNMSLTTKLSSYGKEFPKDYDPNLTAGSGNLAYIYLQNTSCTVSVNLYFEVQYETFPTAWDYHYMAVGSAPPDFEESYHDGTYEDMEDAKEDFAGQMLKLSPGWNEIELFQGEYSRST